MSFVPQILLPAEKGWVSDNTGLTNQYLVYSPGPSGVLCVCSIIVSLLIFDLYIFLFYYMTIFDL